MFLKYLEVLEVRLGWFEVESLVVLLDANKPVEFLDDCPDERTLRLAFELDSFEDVDADTAFEFVVTPVLAAIAAAAAAAAAAVDDLVFL